MNTILPIKDFPGYYISKTGNVYSVNYNHTGKIKKLKLKKEKDGYIKVGLFKNKKQFNKFVHRLVADAFLPNPYNLPIVNHKNGNPSDNRVENLEWCTQRENVLHSYRILGRGHFFGKDNPKSKIVLQIQNKKIIAEFHGIREAQRKTGIERRSISGCCNHHPKFNTAGGYEWEFK